MPMKAEVKEKWVKTLRSRKFKQTQEYLKRDFGNGKFGHCCLGVLHEIDGGNWHTNKYGDVCTGSRNRINSDVAYLRGKFTRGLSKNEMEQLVELNDDQGKKFYQIANWIEKNIKTKN